MIAVLFEVELRDAAKARYLALAAELKEQLSTMDGFVAIERFQSVSNDKKLLSLSFWRDELAVKSWRDNWLHQQAQQQGKAELFSRYTIRIMTLNRHYSFDPTDKMGS